MNNSSWVDILIVTLNQKVDLVKWTDRQKEKSKNINKFLKDGDVIIKYTSIDAVY